MYLFNEGSHLRLYDKLGSHPATVDGVAGYHFAVWAPNADYVSVVGDFNGWDRGANPLQPVGSSGVWGGFIPGVDAGHLLQVPHRRARRVHRREDRPVRVHLRDPAEVRRRDVGSDLRVERRRLDGDPQGEERARQAPVSIYEVHLGSWMREADPPYHSLNYRDVAPKLADVLQATWGSRTSSCCRSPNTRSSRRGATRRPATSPPTSRYGTPQDLMFLIDTLHQHGIGVILDWVPSHFATDALGAGEVRRHRTCTSTPTRARGSTRTGAASSSTTAGTRSAASCCRARCSGWTSTTSTASAWMRSRRCCTSTTRARTASGSRTSTAGKENIDAIDVPPPVQRGGVPALPGRADATRRNRPRGRWCRGRRTSAGWGSATSGTWAGCTTRCKYFALDPIHRKYHQNDLTFRMLYAYNENFVLPLSHDEVVHGKGPLWDKMAGDEWQKFAGLRLLFALPVGHARQEAPVHGRRDRPAAGVAARPEHRLAPAEARAAQGRAERGARPEQAVRGRAGAARTGQPAGRVRVDRLHRRGEQRDLLPAAEQGRRRDRVAFNFTPVPRHDYRVGVPGPGSGRK